MIPIYLNEKTKKQLETGQYTLKLGSKIKTLDDLLIRGIAVGHKFIGRYDPRFLIKPGGKILMKQDNSKTVDYAEIFEGLSPQQEAFIILYNSIDYFDKRLGMSPYLNEMACYLLVYVPEDELGIYGEYLDPSKIDNSIDEDGGFDKVYKDFNNRVGNFQFKSISAYISLKKKALAIRRSPKVIQAFSRIVETFCGDDAGIKQEVIKSTIDIVRNTKNDEVRLKANKLLGEWFGIEKKDQNATLNVILSGINTATSLEEDLEEDEN